MERKIGTFGLSDFYATRKRKRENFLDDIAPLIKWNRLEKLLRRKLRRSEANAVGVKAYPALIMFKILLLQVWHDLSDLDMEYALCDRISFARFTGFSLEDETPDHTTICRFRNLLVERGLMQKLLDEVNSQLEEQGKLVKTGCIVDASIIPSSARPMKRVDIEFVPEDRKEDEHSPDVVVHTKYSQDTEAAWTCKGNKFFYSYKVHAGTDSKDGFILSGHVTPANKSDTSEFRSVVERAKLPKGSRIYADKGYPSKDNRDFLRQQKFKDGILDKAQRNCPLTVRQRKRNRLISAVRGTVERTFGTLKRNYALNRASYLGAAKVELEFLLCAIAFNIKKAILLPST